ncbi:SH3 domain-containing protein [Nioella aestuarii]|uniref:SH3 domain-containing protein n=1 Tax=Nioella aestuarii TaxID=1662864 RepID=UPI003D7F9264
MLRFALFAGAIALASPAAAFPRVYFFCMTDDQSPPVIRVGPMSPNQTEARFLYPRDHDGERREHEMLWIGANGAGEIRYHSGDLSLDLAAEDTSLQVGDTIIPCTMLELPQDHPRGDYPAMALSVGGELRSGPGPDQPETGEIASGTRLYLQSRSGEQTGGYSWFELYDPTGSTEYVWGGDICPGYEPLEGALPSCDP